ncbi:DUF58 domain-containing protein [soil metagenome]
MSLKTRWRSAWRNWWDARHPRADTHLMGQNNVYILPSRPGLAFCLTLALLLLGAINDQLSLGYALTFLLAGAGLASMHLTHGNLRGLALDLKPPQPVFAGEAVSLNLRLHNSSRARFGIGVHLQGSPDAEIAWVDVPAQGHATLTLRYPAAARGLRALPPLQIVSRFPLGLFRAWSVWRPAAEVWVYPQPEAPTPPFPDRHHHEAAGPPQALLSRRSGMDFDGVRAYRRGDSMRQVLWKKAALSLDTGTPLWVRDGHAPAARQRWLDWRDAAPLALEARLSRLTAWVLAAERAQAPFGLRLAGFDDAAPALGAAHLQDCLQALARGPLQ